MRKRDTSRPQNTCPGDLIFLRSRCVRSQGAQAWSATCKSPETGAQSIISGECDPHEICVDGRMMPSTQVQGLITSIAWCVGQDTFVRIAMRSDARQTASSKIRTGFHPTQANSYTVEAILTGLDRRQLVEAKHLEIEAQASRPIGNVLAWGTLIDGVDECDNCSTAEIMTVPTGTKRIAVKAEMMPNAQSALLFLASVFNGA